MLRVIKIGGRAQNAVNLRWAIQEAASLSQVIVVHGGGDEVSALQRRLGIQPKFHQSLRVTTSEDLEVLQMALGSANKRLVRMLMNEGVRAVGISGEDAGTLQALRIAEDKFGEVGVIERVDPRLIVTLLDDKYVPVVSPLSRNWETGGTLNVNGDDVASAIAIALAAEELLFVSDVPGVLMKNMPVSQINVADVEALIASGEAVGGMTVKLQAACRAAKYGVKVRIGNIQAIQSAAAGTTIVAT
jgi:acetylglutamate kinase